MGDRIATGSRKNTPAKKHGTRRGRGHGQGSPSDGGVNYGGVSMTSTSQNPFRDASRSRTIPPRTLPSAKRETRLAAWNVRMLVASSKGASLAQVLTSYRVDLSALSEVRWGGSGEVVVDDYLLLWSGRNDGLKRDGVAQAISVRARRSLMSWKRFQHSCWQWCYYVEWSTGPLGGRFCKPSSRGSTAVLFS